MGFLAAGFLVFLEVLDEVFLLFGNLAVLGSFASLRVATIVLVLVGFLLGLKP